MKKILAIVLALMLALTMCAGAVAETENPVAGKKVAYVMLLPSATIFQMWKDSCADLCKALDVDFDFFFCNGDFNDQFFCLGVRGVASVFHKSVTCSLRSAPLIRLVFV